MADTGPEAARRLLSTVRAAAGRILERGGGIGQNASVGHVDPPQLGEGWGGKFLLFLLSSPLDQGAISVGIFQLSCWDLSGKNVDKKEREKSGSGEKRDASLYSSMKPKRKRKYDI